jgi:hypothetical protein
MLALTSQQHSCGCPVKILASLFPKPNMPTILPTEWRSFAASTHSGEFKTLELLAEHLPDELTVFHGLHWTKAAEHHTQWGEIDFCILHPSGRILVIEQKNGELEEAPEGLVKHYNDGSKNVARQIGRSVEQLRKKFHLVHGKGRALEVNYLIYCPDYRLKSLNAVSLDRSCIVDASQSENLPKIVAEKLSGKLEADEPWFQRIFEFFCDDLRLEPDVNAYVKKQKQHYVQLADGLAETLAALDFSPYRLCVRGTAGSGKTQAALKEFRRATDARGAVLFTCFNRPLANHFAALVGKKNIHFGTVATFHHLCRDIAAEQGCLPANFAPATADWDVLLAEVLQRDIPARFLFDTVIVDEGQDFSPDWIQLLDRLLRPQSRLLWLEDARQNLYARPVCDFLSRYPHGVILNANRNFRNPRSVVRKLYELLGVSPKEIRAANPLEGMEVGIHIYKDALELANLSAQCLGALEKSGFTAEQMVLLSFHGLKHSQFLQQRKLAMTSLKRFTGEYDDKGQQVMEEGDVLVESIYRFKGQHASAIVFSEIDFETLTDAERNRLFCGMTRATVKLDMVMSERAAKMLGLP